MDTFVNSFPAAAMFASLPLRVLIATTIGTFFGAVVLNFPHNFSFLTTIEPPSRVGANVPPSNIFGHPKTISMTGINTPPRTFAKGLLYSPNIPPQYIFGLSSPSICMAPASPVELKTSLHIYTIAVFLALTVIYLSPPWVFKAARSVRFYKKEIVSIPAIIIVDNFASPMDIPGQTGHTSALSHWDRHITQKVLFRAFERKFFEELYQHSIKQFLVYQWSAHANYTASKDWVKHVVAEYDGQWRAFNRQSLATQQALHDAKVAALESELQKATDKWRKYQRSNQTLNNEKRTTASALYANRKEISALQRELGDTKHALKRELGESKQKCQVSDGMTKRLEAQLSEMTAQLSEMTFKYQDLLGKDRRDGQQTASANADLRSAVQDRDKYKRQIEEARNNFQAKLREKSAAQRAAEEMVKKLQDEVKQLKDEAAKK